MKKQLFTALVACNIYAYSEETLTPKKALTSLLKQVICKEKETKDCLTREEICTIVDEAVAAASKHIPLEQKPEKTTAEEEKVAKTEATSRLTAPAEPVPAESSTTEATSVESK
jgi:hypothetical protein